MGMTMTTISHSVVEGTKKLLPIFSGIATLQVFDLIYLATPYSKYPGSLELAFRDAARLTAKLLKEGVSVYSPIAHTHPIAIHGDIDPLDHSIWLKFDEAMMEKADALVVAMMPTWEISYGIGKEIEWFLEHDKPIYYLNPEDMGVSI